MTKRNTVGKSMFVRNWSNFHNQPDFNDAKIQRGFKLAKKLMEDK